MEEIRKFEAELVKRYAAAPTGFVTDALRRLGIGGWTDDIFPVNHQWRLCGRARTMRYAPKSGIKRSSDNNYSVIRRCDPGDVLIVATEGSPNFTIGENVTHLAIHAGLGGIVTDGRIRDSGELREMALPVFSRGAAVRSAAEIELVECDVPVSCGGALIYPGDLVVGDADGVVVVPHQAADAAIIEVDDMAELEAEQAEAIKSGASLEIIKAIVARKKKLKGQPFSPVTAN